jgi:hypothetical protein
MIIALQDPDDELPLEPISIQQGEEKLEILLFAVVRRRRHEQEVAANAGEKLPQAVALCVFALATEKGGRELVRLVANNQIVTAVGSRELLVDVFVPRYLVKSGDGQIVFEKPVAGPGSFELVVCQDLKWKVETTAQLILPLLDKTPRANN